MVQRDWNFQVKLDLYTGPRSGSSLLTPKVKALDLYPKGMDGENSEKLKVGREQSALPCRIISHPTGSSFSPNPISKASLQNTTGLPAINEEGSQSPRDTHSSGLAAVLRGEDNPDLISIC